MFKPQNSGGKMSLEQTACEDLKAFERRLTEVISCLQPSTLRWRIVLVIVSICTAVGAYYWLTDPNTSDVSFIHSLCNHPFFSVSCCLLIFLNTMGESSLSAFSYLLAYSVLMFTVPFLGFYGTRTSLRTYFEPTDRFTEIILSVGVAVLSMFTVMAFYIRHAFHTNRLDAEEAELNKQD